MGDQAPTIDSVGGQTRTQATIIGTSVAPIVQCFALETMPVGGVIEAEGPKQLVSWIGLIGLVALGLVAIALKRHMK
jgi:hypothetical protein